MEGGLKGQCVLEKNNFDLFGGGINKNQAIPVDVCNFNPAISNQNE